MAGLRTHTGSADVVLHACGALANIATNNNDNKVLIDQSALHCHRVYSFAAHCSMVISFGQLCRVINSVCLCAIAVATSENCRQACIVAAGGVIGAFAGMNAHPNSEKVISLGCSALRNISSCGDNERVCCCSYVICCCPHAYSSVIRNSHSL